MSSRSRRRHRGEQNPRVSHPEKPRGQDGSELPEAVAEEAGAVPESEGQAPAPGDHAGPVPLLPAEMGTRTPRFSHREGRLRETRTRGANCISTAGRRRHRVCLCSSVRAGKSGGWRLNRTPGFLDVRTPCCKGTRPHNTGPSHSPSEHASPGAGRVDENQPTLGASGKAGPVGGASAWPQQTGRGRAPPPRTPRSVNTPTRQSLPGCGLWPFFSSARFKLIIHFNFMNY